MLVEVPLSLVQPEGLGHHQFYDIQLIIKLGADLICGDFLLLKLDQIKLISNITCF